MFIKKNGKIMALYKIMEYEAVTKNYELVPHITTWGKNESCIIG